MRGNSVFFRLCFHEIIKFSFWVCTLLFITFGCGGGGGGGNSSQDNEGTVIDGLIAFYAFDEVCGNIALDAHVNDYYGDITAASRVEGRIGDGLLFGFDNARVRIEDILYFNRGLITV